MIYVHIPFCHRKCTYCAFHSAAGKHDMEGYVDALCREIERNAGFFGSSHQPRRTLYFGGGTPTLLPLPLLERIVQQLGLHFDLSHLEEMTIEANPENLSPEYLDGLRRLHFNRISIGVQSFNDGELKTLNRSHNAQQAVDAIKMAQQAGFDNISVDLIYGLPAQTVDSWRRCLSLVGTLSIQHLSCYALTIEEGTMLERQTETGRVLPADEETVVAQYEALCQWAQASGFEQYEISNFCRHGHASIHNSRYWRREPYLGLGAAAHSFDGNNRRYTPPDTERYINGDYAYTWDTLSDKDAYNETVMLGLRTMEGIAKERIAARWMPHLRQSLQPYMENGLVEETPTHFRPTHEGLLHADGIATNIIQ